MAKHSGSPFVVWRKKAEVTGTELALALGISKTHLSDLERGTANISDSLLVKVGEVGGFDAKEFLDKHKAWMEERKSSIVQKLKVKP